MAISIMELMGLLSTAIWQRAKADHTFDLFYHLTHPEQYVPKTEQELQIWETITHPDNYIELCELVAHRRTIPGVGGYPVTMDCLLLAAAKSRYEASK